MNDIVELAKAESLGMVYKGPCGNINVCVQGVTLHFTESAFWTYARMVKAAVENLMERGLQRITEIPPEEDPG